MEGGNEQVARDSVRELQKGNCDPAIINAIFEEVQRKYNLPFLIKIGQPKEDGLRRQWAVSLDPQSKIAVLPSPIEYPPVTGPIYNWWESSGSKKVDQMAKNPEFKNKIFAVDYMEKDDYLDVALNCAKMLLAPEFV